MTALPLPAWANCPEGRALVEQIIVEVPDHFIRSGAWIDGGRVRHYTGKAVAKLRALYSHRRDRLIREADAAYFAGTPWDECSREFNALLASEQPDALIERVLRETERADLEPKELPGGWFQVAA